VECILDPLYQSSQSSVASFASLGAVELRAMQELDLQRAEQGSEQALSQQLPVRLMEALIPCPASRSV
jgi:hypothetical protein